jgi:hypothetical protein
MKFGLKNFEPNFEKSLNLNIVAKLGKILQN